MIAVGAAAEDESSYSKSTALQTWLLGYEFPDTILAITETGFVFLTSSKKGSILESLIDPKGIPINILKRTKDADHNAKLFTEFFALLAKSFDGVFFLILSLLEENGYSYKGKSFRKIYLRI